MGTSMIEPHQSGAVLLDDIQMAQPAYGEIAIWWLGQSGYAIKTANHLLYIDLYLSEHLTDKYANTEKPHIRMTRSPIRGDEITNAKWVFASHKHSDHLDPGTISALLNASPDACLVLPFALVDHAVSLGVNRNRIVGTRGDETFNLDSMTVHSLPSSHPNLDYSEGEGYPYQGFVVEMDGLTLYHSGDTVIYDSLAERLKRFDLDIVFLPINGTDSRRTALKVPPNMNAQDAVELAQIVDARLLIPHHYDMLTFNTVDVREFAALASNVQLPFAILNVGQRFVWRKFPSAEIFS